MEAVELVTAAAEGLGFRVQAASSGFELRLDVDLIRDLGFRVYGLGFRVRV